MSDVVTYLLLEKYVTRLEDIALPETEIDVMLAICHFKLSLIASTVLFDGLLSSFTGAY